MADVLTGFVHIWTKLVSFLFDGATFEGTSLGWILVVILVMTLLIASIVPIARATPLPRKDR